MPRRDSSWTRVGGGGGLCVVPGVMSTNVPIETDLASSLPASGELLSIAGVVTVLVMAGRWAHHRLRAGAADLVLEDEDGTIVDSEQLWQELEAQDEPVGV